MAMKEAEEQNISRYIRNLDVSLGLENNYIDPSVAQAYRSSLEQQKNIKTTTISARYNSDSVRFDVVGVPPVLEGMDPRKMCPFCQKTFSHPGSMGRHLDLKKGSKDHPAQVIDEMRADVKRRGDAEKVKERRRIRARKYNAREEVKERTKVQRRARERVQRAKRRVIKKFFDKLGRPHLQPHPTFPRLVLYFLPPTQWPHDPPTLETYRLLCGSLNDQFLPSDDMTFYDDVMQEVHTASETWLTLADDSKNELWLRELQRAAQDALQNTSLFDLRNRDVYVAKEARRQVDNNEDTNDGNDESNDDDDSNDNSEDADHDDEEKNGKEYYDQDQLAAVAEAVVNKEHHHLDPDLIT